VGAPVVVSRDLSSAGVRIRRPPVGGDRLLLFRCRWFLADEEPLAVRAHAARKRLARRSRLAGDVERILGGGEFRVKLGDLLAGFRELLLELAMFQAKLSVRLFKLQGVCPEPIDRLAEGLHGTLLPCALHRGLDGRMVAIDRGHVDLGGGGVETHRSASRREHHDRDQSQRQFRRRHVSLSFRGWVEVNAAFLQKSFASTAI